MDKKYLKRIIEVNSNESLIEEKAHMKSYQVLPVRYMCSDNNVIKRFFLIYHSPGTGKSFTALWIPLNFIKVFEKKTLILVKSLGIYFGIQAKNSFMVFLYF